MQNPTHCHEFLTLCPECKAVLGDSWAVVRLGRTDITGGYLVFPSEKSAVQHSFSKSFPHNDTHDLLRIQYPTGTVKGYAPKLNLSLIGNWSLSANFSQYPNSTWGILVTEGMVVLNPDPWSILEEIRVCHTFIYKIIIYHNGTVKEEGYGIECWAY